MINDKLKIVVVVVIWTLCLVVMYWLASRNNETW